MRKRLVVGLLCLMVFTLTAYGESTTQQAAASSHREAPSISQDPAADNTDVYMFRSPDNLTTVTLVANYYPYQNPAGGPNFYRFGDDVLYEFHINNSGNARDDITYQFRFHTSIVNRKTFLYNTGPLTTLDSPNWSYRQTYTIRRIQHGRATVLARGLQTPPSNVGTHSIPNYATLRDQAVYTVDKDIKVFAGQRADPFFADVGAIFDLLTIRGGIPAGFSSGGHNTFAGYNLQTIALQIPIDKLTRCQCTPGSNDDPVVGFWASASRHRLQNNGGLTPDTPEAQANGAGGDGSDFGGDWVQVSRLGLPLINEVVIPLGLKDKFNASQPVNDVANFAGPVTDPELARLLHTLYGISVPPTPRTDLVEALLKGVPGLNRPRNVVPSDMLRLNVTTPLCGTKGAPACSTLGVLGGDLQGFPNGRRLTDDVVDAAERVVAGVLVQGFNVFPNNTLGDGVNAPAAAPLAAFPYVPDPYDGFTTP